jgi:hypothetical protein
MTKRKREEQFHMRIEASTLSRWKERAKQANLSLSAYVEKKVNGKTIEPPIVPAINPAVALRLGNIEMQLRRVGNNINQIAAVLNTAKAEGKELPEQLPAPESLQQLLELIDRERKSIAEVALGLYGISKTESEKE